LPVSQKKDPAASFSGSRVLDHGQHLAEQAFPVDKPS
jgi:hypothetical protein